MRLVEFLPTRVGALLLALAGACSLGLAGCSDKGTSSGNDVDPALRKQDEQVQAAIMKNMMGGGAQQGSAPASAPAETPAETSK